MYCSLALIALMATVAIVSADGDMHHITEEEFCKLPNDKRDKLWKCFEPKVPKKVVITWTDCAKKIYGVDSPYQAAMKMCTNDEDLKHKQMEECCESSKKDLTDEEMIKIINDCMKVIN
ncbi:uncharacterized protein LOC111618696 [Centruroides sculpturatus]|uniref:uncharacterized protein LOC111618696 n=1 Tax=Centruroides sculpturatus TaxID=218467 RepID=UPI000C6EDFEA|nr:uncharacterized protein LOC111618696 [Centruroides sculpturatus]